MPQLAALIAENFDAEVRFLQALVRVPTDTPQFFPSMLGSIALLEGLLAFIVAETDTAAVASIEAVHRGRTAAGVYWPDDAPVAAPRPEGSGRHG